MKKEDEDTEKNKYSKWEFLYKTNCWNWRRTKAAEIALMDATPADGYRTRLTSKYD